MDGLTSVIILSATAAASIVAVGKIMGSGRSILYYQVRCSNGPLIETGHGEQLGDLNGYVVIVTENSEAPFDDNAVGRVHYLENFVVDGLFNPQKPDRACFVIEVCTTDAKRDELVAAAIAGKLPATIAVQVAGLDDNGTGSSDDVDDLKWDRSARPYLQVLGISFGLALLAR